MMAPLSSRQGVKVAAYKEHRFDSLIPEVISDMNTDAEYQEMVRKTRERGQAALTREENAKRQAVLSELDIIPWQRKMKVSLCCWRVAVSDSTDLGAQPLCASSWFSIEHQARTVRAPVSDQAAKPIHSNDKYELHVC